MSTPLVIVESPAKARTISRFLGQGFMVESSIGHIRDLPAKPTEIPPALRGKPWARTGVDIENDFQPLWVIPASKKPTVKKLKDLLKKATVLYLATDEDREGEAIAWHLKEVLAPKVPVQRMVFHEITKKAIDEALAHPRQIDARLVQAQEARRILDRLYGYELSPVLWRKIRPRLSAGRVQSVATRLVVERERSRMAFVRAGYWSLAAQLQARSEAPFLAELQQLGGRRIATGRHFAPESGELSKEARGENVLVLDEPLARSLEQALAGADFEVASVERKPFVQRPYAPFITSTLQQEAARKLRFSAQRTMRVAQHLYERGYITYMRTDSTQLSQQAIDAARQLVGTRFGAEYLPPSPRLYEKKAKGAQEAHEAIRPAGEEFRIPESLSSELSREALDLYTLIWKRTVASQMKDAVGERTRVTLRASTAELGAAQGGAAQEALFAASGKTITFPGYLRAYVEGADDPEAELEDRERVLPVLTEGEQLRATSLQARGHTTQPPARYTEASLVKELEERGIGRPSTYANILQTIQDRGYVSKQGTALVPTLTAFAVVRLLEAYFCELVDYDFTARMEADLDAIGNGDKDLRPWLEAFYFGAGGKDGNGTNGATEALPNTGLQKKIASSVDLIDAREVCSLTLGKTADGQLVAARVGRYGPYLQIGDDGPRAPIPDSVLPDQLTVETALRLLQERDLSNRELGVDPQSGKTVTVKSGVYGPYVQLGEPELTPKGNLKKGGKPKMASLWPGMSAETIELDQALMLLSFPKLLGKHPEHGAEITVQDGKFGPYLQMITATRKETRSLNHEQLATITFDEALQLLAQPRPRATSRKVVVSLGRSEANGRDVEVRTGRFGPYVTDGVTNAKIPRGRDPSSVTLEHALEWLAERAQQLADQGIEPGTRKAAKRGRARRTG